jgi:hypothetical protein
MNMLIESLEGRALMAAWNLSDALADPTEAGPFAEVDAMAADRFGNVFAVGTGYDAASNTGPCMVREKPSGGSSWVTLFQSTTMLLDAMTTDASGDLFVGGRNVALSSGTSGAPWTILERSAPTAANPAPTFKTIDSVVSSLSNNCTTLTTDVAGNVFAGGNIITGRSGSARNNWAVRKGTYNPSSANWSFSTLEQFVSSSAPAGLSVVNSGASTGVYAVGSVSGSWTVRKSSNGGSTWSQVDSFRYDTVAAARSVATGITSDSSGNLYVVGYGAKSTITGYTRNHTPIYSSSPDHWLVRKSATGNSGTWSIADDYQLSSANASGAYAVTADPAGNVYVAGEGDVPGSDGISTFVIAHATVRTNVGGSWSTVDSYYDPAGFSAWYNAVAADSAGNHYAGGADWYTNDTGWVIRTDVPAPTASATGGSASVFSWLIRPNDARHTAALDLAMPGEGILI